MKKFVAGLLLLISLWLIASLSVASAARANETWTQLATRRVMLMHDHDTIPVTLARGDFSKLKVVVEDNGIFVNHFIVEYSNGGTDRIPVGHHIPAGGSTRDLDLRGHDRFIRRIDVHYRSVRNFKGRARLTVWGRR